MGLSIEQIAAAIQELGIENTPLTRAETIQLLTNMADTLKTIKDSPAFLELTEHEEFYTNNDLFIQDAIQALNEIVQGANRVRPIIDAEYLASEFSGGQDFYRYGEDRPPENIVSAEFLRGYDSARLQSLN